ncbi:MAG TPA: transporter [Geomonas sp.]|nr:transporter [Geomonas sp.]
MRMRTETVTLLLAILVLVATAFEASAQDLEPRAYVNTPVGMNFLVAGYGYLDGGVGTDPSAPLQDAKVTTHSALFAYARALDVWGMSGKFDLVVPYAWASGSASYRGESRERSVSGFADPRFRFSVNFYGAPALSMPEFEKYRQDLIVGGSLQLSAPLGQYDSSKLLNIGTNRWSIRPELGISKAFGPLTLELATNVTFYTENDDFFGGHKVEQNPIYSVQGHLVYRFRSGIWAAAGADFYGGGRTTLDGERQENLQQNWRLGGTVAFPVSRKHSLKLFASTGVSTRTGSNFDALGVVWQYRWGGGI